MKFRSTRDSSKLYSPRDACLLGLAPDGGLFLPASIPTLRREVCTNPESVPLQELAAEIATPYFAPDLSASDIREIVDDVLTFPVPLKHVRDQIFVLELFHGPTAAFKDFGALFLARAMSRLWKSQDRELNILVATSGDTGGAVAHGFLNVPGVKVFILYPSGRVSPLQEKQMTTLGRNIVAIEVLGSFDDCQNLVKRAFTDAELRDAMPLTSANSINFARLLPQTFFDIEALRQIRLMLGSSDRMGTTISVPSGNLGNLCAGVIAKKSGLPIGRLLLAANRNRAAVDYLQNKAYSPRVSEHTLSNAMDVGHPSNLERLIALYDSHAELSKDVCGSSWSEEETKGAIRRVFLECGYLLDPHGAVGFLALEDYVRNEPQSPGVVLQTAHPGKFAESVREQTGQPVPLPPQFQDLNKREKRSQVIPARYEDLKDLLHST